MPRYIDADALKDVIQQHDYPLADRLNSIDNGMFTLGIFQAIDEQPTISPDDVRGVGKWIVKQTATGIEYTSCSRCDLVFYYESRSGEFEPVDMRGCIYCMGCGARMKGADDGTTD